MFGSINRDSSGSIQLKGFHSKDTAQSYFKSARGFFGWLHDIRNGKIDRVLADGKYPIYAYANGNNWLFGHFVEGIFILCYISADTHIGMFKTIKSICEHNNVVFEVTLDIASQLERLELFTDGKIHIAKFHGHEVEKKIFATSVHALKKALLFEKVGKLAGTYAKNGQIDFDKIKNDFFTNGKLDVAKAKSILFTEAMKPVYLVCIDPADNHNKFYRMIPDPSGTEYEV